MEQIGPNPTCIKLHLKEFELCPYHGKVAVLTVMPDPEVPDIQCE